MMVTYLDSTHLPELSINTSVVRSALSDHWEYEFYRTVFTYVAPVLLSVGTVGNLVCLLVLHTRTFRGTTHALLLSALAVADLGVLHTGLLRHVLKMAAAGYDVRVQSAAACKLHYFLTYLFPHLSSWTLVLVTLERLLSLCLPFKVKVICTRQRVVGAWLVMTFILIALNSHWLKLAEIQSREVQYNSTADLVCSYTPTARRFYEDVWPWVDFAVVSFLPTVLILPCNTLIVLKVVRAGRRRHSALMVTGAPGNTQNVASVTVMLLVVSSVFILTTTPVHIYFIGFNVWPQSTGRERAQMALAYSICTALYYLNSAINFFLYCVSGTHFRVALSVAMRCRPSSADLYRARTGSVNASMMTALVTLNGPLTRSGSLLPPALNGFVSGLKIRSSRDLGNGFNRAHIRHSLDMRSTTNLNVLIDPMRKAASDSCIK